MNAFFSTLVTKCPIPYHHFSILTLFCLISTNLVKFFLLDMILGGFFLLLSELLLFPEDDDFFFFLADLLFLGDIAKKSLGVEPPSSSQLLKGEPSKSMVEPLITLESQGKGLLGIAEQNTVCHFSNLQKQIYHLYLFSIDIA